MAETEISRRCRTDLWILIAITVLAGIPRFARLWHPPLLVDDAFTFWRICGGLGDLFGTLRNDAFTPLYYELLWWLKEGFPTPLGRIVPHGLYPTPPVLRFIPALSGTLMPLAMYFLGRQMLTRRASLIAAFLTACSAYMLWFSRDVKMYQPLWLMITLTVACLLWWVRTGNVRAWMLWIIAAQVAVGFQMIAFLVVLITPVFVLSAKRVRLTTSLMMLIGMLVISAGPLGYYLTFNKWTEKSGGVAPGATGELAPDVDYSLSGLNWLSRDPADREIMNATFTTWATCYELEENDLPTFAPDEGPEGRQFAMFERIKHGLEELTTIGWVATSVVAVMIVTAAFMTVGTLPWSRRWLGRRDDDVEAEPLWRVVLWLGTWIAFIAYGVFYCRSTESPASPVAILSNPVLICGFVGWVVVASLMSLRKLSQFAKSTAYALGACVIVIVLCAVAWAVINHVRAATYAKNPGLQWQSLWHTRYVALVWPALTLVVAALFDRIPTWPLRWTAIGILAAANLVNGVARIYVESQIRFDYVWRDVWLDKPGSTTHTFVDLNLGGGGPLPGGNYYRMVPAYYAVVMGHLYTTPQEHRVGGNWPFTYGTKFNEIRRMANIRDRADVGTVRTDVAASPDVRRVIVWTRAVDNESLPTMLEGFHAVDDNTYVYRWAWNWHDSLRVRRLDLVRD